MALVKIKFDNTETGLTVGEKINNIIDHINAELTYASEQEAIAGVLTNKIISPKTLKTTITSEIGTQGVMTKSVYDTNNNGTVDNSEKVNGLTVETAVPAGAVFTDTTYTAGQGLTLTGNEFSASIALNEITDVNIATLSTNQVLSYNGTNWVNSTLPAAPVDSVNGQTGTVVLTTDDVNEGTKKYYSTSLFNTDFVTKSIQELADVGFNTLNNNQFLSYDGTKWTNTDLPAFVSSINNMTGDVTFNMEHINNVSITTLQTNQVLSYDGTNWVNTDLPQAPVTSVNTLTGDVNLDTDNIPEGTKKYYNTSLFNTDFATKSVGELSDVDTSTNIPTDGQVLTYSNSKWVNSTLPTAPVTSVNTKTGDVDLTTTDIAEGTNLYYTDARVNTVIDGLKGVADGLATLDSNGLVPSSQLPAYVDDVIEYPTLADFPATGDSHKIYIAADTNKTYRWSGTSYVEISASLALGETSSTAYRGDRGKIAYDHSQTTGNPHNATTDDITEGSTNLYYTDARFDTRFSTKSVGELSDVDTTGAADGKILTYLNNKWVTGNPVTYTAGVGLSLTGTEFALDAGLEDLNNTTITTPTTNQVLSYDGTKWVNSTLPTAPVDSVNGQTGVVVLGVNDLDDAVITSATSGQVLTFDGTNWVNQTPSTAPVDSVNGQTGAVVLGLNDINDVDTTGVQDGQILTYSSTGSNWVVTTPVDKDENVKVSANDTTTGYLRDKITNGRGILIVTNSGGANENLNVSAQTWVDVINGNNIPVFWDANRGKNLSIETHYMLFSEAYVNATEWFSISKATDAESSYIAEFDGTIVGVSGYCVDANPTGIDLYINGTKVSTIVNFQNTGGPESVNEQLLNIDITQGDRIRIRNNGGNALADTNISLRVKWRKA